MTECPELTKPLLITEPEAAQMLAISPRKLWSLRDKGEITYIRSGRSVRYDVSDLEAWIQNNRVTPTPSNN